MYHDNYTTRLTVRVDLDSAKRFVYLCIDKGLTTSQCLRLLIERYLNENDQAVQHDQL